jgi:hypothetical protein
MKQKTFFENHLKQTINLRKQEKTVSTLRIPLIRKSVFNKGVAKHGSVATYLGFLLKKYRLMFYAGKIPFSKKVKTEYQERGTKVFVKTFRPELKDWLELGIWASALNYTMCKLFAVLLELEYQEERVHNEKFFSDVGALVTTLFGLRFPRLVKVLRNGRNILERGFTLYEPPE